MTDTIFALSSGSPPAAIAVVRISGPAADAALAALVHHELPAPHKATLKTLRHDGQALDTALIIRFPGSRSATGEDVVELHLHGGRATVAVVCKVLAGLPGFRPAEPGEFTRRAFANGRIDLAQAEGLSDLLRAETESQRRAAMTIAEGGLSRLVEAVRRDLLEASARVEAAIDFDDEDDVQPWPERCATLNALASRVAGHLDSPTAERLHNGLRIVVAGPPNAGKSSLINCLSARDAAIVSPIAGTTRDVIEVPVHIRGMPVILTDTAGLRGQTDDSIEAIGIARAESKVAAADIVVWLGDPLRVPNHPNVICVRTKADLGGVADERLAVSSITGAGIVVLLDRITAVAATLLPTVDSLALNQRQRSCLSDLQTDVSEAARTDDLLVAAEHLRKARLALDRLTGRAGVEEMLDALFGTFCIGK
jgi:tRNA modification GTPase